MQYVLVALICVGCAIFLFCQIRGIVNDFKKRKDKKKADAAEKVDGENDEK